ncbi:hypothetical protein Cs7R123_04620 [Catellatospora sp. TT07R-123]|nr:hypothetical protein Cs7R123_04620 [Catellatospora sp. TT07R-123]
MRSLPAVLCAALIALGGCDGDADRSAPPPSAPPPAASAAPSGPPPVCPTDGPTPAKPGSRDPFGALGARQEPGPAMTPSRYRRHRSAG